MNFYSCLKYPILDNLPGLTKSDSDLSNKNKKVSGVKKLVNFFAQMINKKLNLSHYKHGAGIKNIEKKKFLDVCILSFAYFGLI